MFKREKQQGSHKGMELLKAVEDGNFVKAKSLLNDGADSNWCKDGDHSALILASDNGDEDLVEILIKYGANVNYSNDLGETALHCAAVIGAENIVKKLISSGANINVGERFGNVTPLGYAIHHGHKGVVEILRQSGALE